MVGINLPNNGGIGPHDLVELEERESPKLTTMVVRLRAVENRNRGCKLGLCLASKFVSKIRRNNTQELGTMSAKI